MPRRPITASTMKWLVSSIDSADTPSHFSKRVYSSCRRERPPSQSSLANARERAARICGLIKLNRGSLAMFLIFNLVGRLKLSTNSST